MGSRIFWIVVAGLALATGMVIQDHSTIFGWAAETGISTRTEQAIDRAVDRTVDRTVDRIQVMDSEGQAIAVPPEMKRALADATGRLVKAEAELAVLGVRGADDAEMQAATVRRDQARTEVEQLKGQMEQLKQLSAGERDASRDQLRNDIREEVRAAVRDAVRG